LVIAIWVGLAFARTAPKVTITGRADKSGKQYVWTVTNEYCSAVVRVEFPHYMADLFTSPTGWTGELIRMRMISRRKG